MTRNRPTTIWNSTGSEGYLADTSGNLITDDNGNYLVVFLGSGLSHVTTVWT